MRYDDDFILGTFGEPFASPSGPGFEGFRVGGPEAGLGIPLLNESSEVNAIKFLDLFEGLSRAPRVRRRRRVLLQLRQRNDGARPAQAADQRGQPYQTRL